MENIQIDTTKFKSSSLQLDGIRGGEKKKLFLYTILYYWTCYNKHAKI